VAYARQTGNTAIITLLNFGSGALGALTVSLPWTAGTPETSVLLGDGNAQASVAGGKLSLKIGSLAGLGAALVKVQVP
jgi:hypothetical protein